jgi:hypothetical protein
MSKCPTIHFKPDSPSCLLDKHAQCFLGCSQSTRKFECRMKKSSFVSVLQGSLPAKFSIDPNQYTMKDDDGDLHPEGSSAFHRLCLTVQILTSHQVVDAFVSNLQADPS